MKMKTLSHWLTTACWMAAAGLLAGNTLAEIITPGDYSNQLQIKFPGYTGVTPLTNFPALVQLTEDFLMFNYSDMESEDYSDLRFADSTGTNAIPYEVEQWNSTVTTPVTPTTLSGCLLWLKADAGIQTNSVGGVTNWIDQSSSSYNAVSMATNVHPAYVANVINGQPVVRFSGADDNYIRFPRLTAIRTVFWVIKEDSDASSSQPRFLLGDSGGSGNYHFHRGDNKMIWSSGNAPRMYNGITELNGRAIDGRTTVAPKQMSVLSVRTADTCTADSLSKDRTQTGRSWDGDVAEVIIYNRTLTPAEMAGIYTYLQGKYAIKIAPTATLWVQVPVLTNNVSIYAYWGNPAATTIPDYTTNGTVWADGYVGVYHLTERGATLTFADSSPLNNTMTSISASAETSGKSGQGLYLRPGNAYEPPRISSPSGGLTLDSVTVSLWVNTPSATSWRNWWGIEAGSGNHLRMELDDETIGKCNIYPTGVTGANQIANPSKPVEDGNWHYLAFTADTSANVAKVFVDGLPDGTNVAWSAVAAATGLKIGASWGTYTNGIGGKFDEARFEKSVRSADWIKASYDNQLNPSAFAVVDLDYYYDTSTAADLQAGNGLLSPTNALWSTEIIGTAPLQRWTDGVLAHFEADGTSAVTVEPVSVKKLFFDGTGYTLSGGSINLSQGIEANESATIKTPVKLLAPQEWYVAEGKTLTIDGAGWNIAYTLTKTGKGKLRFINHYYSYCGAGLDIVVKEGEVRFETGYWWQYDTTDAMRIQVMSNATLYTANSTFGFLQWPSDGSLEQVILEENATWNMASNIGIPSGLYSGSGRIVLKGANLLGGSVHPMYASTVETKASSIRSRITSSFNGHVADAGWQMIVENGAAEPDLLMEGSIGANVTGIAKNGAGTAELRASNSQQATTINAGILLVNNTTGSGTGTGPVTINGGTLSGTGTVANAVSFGANGGTIVPGPMTGTLTVKSNVTFTASGAATNRFNVTLNSATDYTRLRVTEGGTVTLANATLNVTLNATLFNTKLFIVVNDGTDPVDGTFKDLPEGEVLKLGPNEDSYTIYYAANADTGDLSGGNDVALVPVPKGTLLLLK